MSAGNNERNELSRSTARKGSLTGTYSGQYTNSNSKDVEEQEDQPEEDEGWTEEELRAMAAGSKTESRKCRQGSLTGTYNGQYRGNVVEMNTKAEIEEDTDSSDHGEDNDENQSHEAEGWTEEQLRAMTADGTRKGSSRQTRKGSLTGTYSGHHTKKNEEKAAEQQQQGEKEQQEDGQGWTQEELRAMAVGNNALNKSSLKTRKGSLTGTYSGKYSNIKHEEEKEDQPEDDEGWTEKELRAMADRSNAQSPKCRKGSLTGTYTGQYRGNVVQMNTKAEIEKDTDSSDHDEEGNIENQSEEEEVWTEEQLRAMAAGRTRKGSSRQTRKGSLTGTYSGAYSSKADEAHDDREEDEGWTEEQLQAMAQR